METKELEQFCPSARVRLIDAVKSRCYAYGLDDEGRAACDPTADIVKGRVLTAHEKRQRAKLYERIEHEEAEAAQNPDAPDGYETFCESVAYAWFNRFAAIRYMEVNEYLPCGVRILSHKPEDPTAEYDVFDPDCLRAATELDLPGLDQQRVRDLLLASDDGALFRYILVAQMNEFAEVLPSIFKAVDEADELLLPENLMSRSDDAVLQPLVEKIKRDTWRSVEVLGWVYQFYNTDVKAEFFKAKRKATAADIAPATQLFTPEWIVRYMVENSLGRLWMLNNPESTVREHMKYYIEPDGEHEDFIHISSPEEITLCDPACGSGHILVYAFELLFRMYEDRDYREREIPELILTKNLAGMDIDPRAVQIAELTLAMCARAHDRRFFRRGVQADITVLKSISLGEDELPNNEKLAEELSHLGEIGSLMRPSEADIAGLKAATGDDASDLFTTAIKDKLQKALTVCEKLSRRFSCVVANPPYMGSSSFNPFMSKWIKKNYPDVKSDLCTCFIERGFSFVGDKGYSAMVTMQSWMFLGSFEKMRSKLIDTKTIVSMVHLGPRAFDAIGGEVVNVTADVIYNQHSNVEGAYVRLVDINGSKAKSQKLDDAIKNPACGWFYRRNAETFKQIPGTPIAYWASDALLDFFGGATISSECRPHIGIQTGDNERFIRKWWEPSSINISFHTQDVDGAVSSGLTWFPIWKGGQYRKWAGNREEVVNWRNDGEDIIGLADGEHRRVMNLPADMKFCPTVCWSMISSSFASFRYYDSGGITEHASSGFYSSRVSLFYLIALCNSVVARECLLFLSPTLNFEVNKVSAIPFPKPASLDETRVESYSSDCISLSNKDWDSCETSWNFIRNPLV